ncbi:MAG: aminotransferase class I/II-fold pyridoxal phosphate-dependent enzyme [Burkholderiaceae bacterium]|nr:aminotransferase class I/II-fold pyridoxal phosphate-dependent enzyme [Burkholderiaceae bacterium]
MTEQELRQQCHTFISGHRPHNAAEDFAAMARWCNQHEGHQVLHDIYGSGELIQSFEKKVADLLGFESALFVVSGTMAQAIALRLACAQADRGRRLVALHPTAHILRHESSNYQLLDHFQVLQVGSPHRPWSVDDLQAISDPLAAVLQELPMREIGGQLPAWEELEKIKAHCRARGAHLHMDGARLWESAAWYGRSHAEIAAGFDSVYVSLYKGLGGMGGAVLLGSAAFIAQAKDWAKRLGGNVIQRSPYVVAAAMQFDERLAAMPHYFQRTVWLYDVLREFPALTVNPAKPQANMLHLYLPVAREGALALRNELAEKHGVWLFNGANHAPLPEQSYVEWYVGDNLLDMPDQKVREVLGLFTAGLISPRPLAGEG